MTTEGTRHFLACHDCGILQPVVHVTSLRFDDVADDALADYKAFVANHAAHRTDRLRRTGFESRADRPLWDPMATLTFAVTDGQHDYVVTAARTSIEEPRDYRFARGLLEMTNAEVAIDEADLRRGLDLEFYPHVLRATKVEQFMALVRDVICNVSPDKLELAFDDTNDPAVSIAPLPDALYERLAEQCADIFDAWESARVRTFLHENRDADGLLALRIRRHFRTLAASAR